ncbi:hypothetical protein Tco_0365713 [Tanacetum coccineum]
MESEQVGLAGDLGLTNNVLIPLVKDSDSGLLVYKLPLSTYSVQQIYTTYSNPLDTAYRSSDTAIEIIAKMKVIKEGSEKLGLLKINDDSFACDTSLGTICNEFNQLSGMDDDLFTYEVEIPGLASISYDMEEEDDLEFTLKQFFLLTKDCYNKQLNEYMEIKKQWVTYGIDADMEYDPSDVEFAKWTRGDDKVGLIGEEFSDPNDEIQLIRTKLLKSLGSRPTYLTSRHLYNGYCNGGNLLGAFRVGNTLRYQDLDWYEALKDDKLKDEALKNKAIIEKLINEDEESYDGAWRRWDDYENTTHNNDEEREPNDDHGIGNLDYDLVRDNASYHTNDKEEQEDKDRCELLYTFLMVNGGF